MQTCFFFLKDPAYWWWAQALTSIKTHECACSTNSEFIFIVAPKMRGKLCVHWRKKKKNKIKDQRYANFILNVLDIWMHASQFLVQHGLWQLSFFRLHFTKMLNVKKNNKKNCIAYPDRWIHSINWSIQKYCESRHYFQLCRSFKNGMQPTESLYTLIHVQKCWREEEIKKKKTESVLK